MGIDTPDNVQERFKYWRQEIARVSQAQLCEEVNRHLPTESEVAVTTISNYERATEPRVSFLDALKKAYPDLNLGWLISGSGEPQLSDEQAAERLRNAVISLGDVAKARVEDDGRFGRLPLPARDALVAFFSDVRLSGPPYMDFNAMTLPSYAPAPEEETAWEEFTKHVEEIFFTPFQAADHFVPLERLSDEQLTNYTFTLILALRPLVRSLRVRAGLVKLGRGDERR